MDHPEIKNFSEKKAVTERGVDQDANLDADSRPYTFDAKTLDTLASHTTYSPSLNTSLSWSFLADIVSFDKRVGSFQHNSSKKHTGSTSNSLDNLHLPISIITLTVCLSH